MIVTDVENMFMKLQCTITEKLIPREDSGNLENIHWNLVWKNDWNGFFSKKLMLDTITLIRNHSLQSIKKQHQIYFNCPDICMYMDTK